MKNALLSTLLVLSTIVLVAQDCSSGRYTNEIFTSVDVSSDIKYGENLDLNGNNTELFVDVYSGQGDTATDRALIVIAHGGSFVGGSRTGSDVVPLCNYFAKLGYVVASMSYRLGMNGIPFPGPDSADATEAVFRATQDARAAVRFFRKDFSENSNSYGIDTSNIFMGGVSAGGFVSLHLAYLEEHAEIPSYIDTINEPGLSGGIEGISGNAGYSSKAKAIINLQGALGKTEWMKPGDTPLVSLHGDADGTVPYNHDDILMLGVYNIMPVHGSSSVHQRAEDIGLNHCYKEFKGADHTPHCCGHANEAEYMDTTKMYIKDFLLQFTCNQAYTCPTPNAGTNNILETRAPEFELYPNPAQDMVTITSERGAINRVDVYSILGNVIETINVNENDMVQIQTSGYPAGTYFVKSSNEDSSITKKLIIKK